MATTTAARKMQRWNIPVTLAGTVALAVFVLFVPLRRAAGLRPGDALRYA